MILLGVIVLTLWVSFWIVHIIMNQEEGVPYGWGNFNKFIKQFNLYQDWQTDRNNIGSYFGNNGEDYNKYYIHAGIIKFNGNCMILDPISYLMFECWRKKKWKEMKGSYKVKWE